MNAETCRRDGKTWFPKDKRCIDLNFRLRDLDGTYHRHLSQINKLTEKGIKFKDILPSMITGYSRSAQYEIEDRLQGNKWFVHNIFDTDNWRKCNQKVAKEMKTAINSETREEIKYQLKDRGLPESYDTAFYAMNYNKTNALMKKILKENIYCD
jgi:hypothetical protein